MPKRGRPKKSQNEFHGYKCQHCKALFDTYESAEIHHNNSRHKKKEVKIINLDEENENVEKTIDEFEEDQDDDRSDPHFLEEDVDDPDPLILPSKRKSNAGRKPKILKESAEVTKDKPAKKAQSDKPTNITPVEGELFYKCIECNEWFNTYDELMSHQLKDHDSEDIDPFISKTKGGAEIPLKSLTKYFCTLCSFETFTIGEIKFHRQDHEDSDRIIRYLMIEPGAVDVKMVEEATYECSECDIMPDILSLMDEHWKENHSSRPLKLSRIYADDKPLDPSKFPCDECNQKFPFDNYLKLHKKLRHA